MRAEDAGGAIDSACCPTLVLGSRSIPAVNAFPGVWTLEVNKKDLSKAVYDAHGGLSQADSLKVVDRMLEIIKQKLGEGEKVLISGFGCFRTVKRKDKRGVNPKTGDPIVIPGRRAITFKPSKYLKAV